MKVTGFSLLILIFPVFSTLNFQSINPQHNQLVSPAGLILPQPRNTNAFQKRPKPLTIRITNHGEETVYLQGVRDLAKEGKVQLYFYHRKEERGWKPYFDSLPCNLPTCTNLSRRQGHCGEGEAVVIRLGAKGTYNSVQEFQWSGLLYELSEAIQENRNRRYCYKGWAPSRGQVRIELEYSKTVSRDEERKERMQGRDHRAIEFKLPASRKIYEIHLNS